MAARRDHTGNAQDPRRDGPLRIVLFTHDTFGLGHVRRCLHILRSLAAADPDAVLLLVTGSPALAALGPLPPNADVVKIPTLARTGEPSARPPHLHLEVRRVTELRTQLIREAVLGLDPHVLLVDNFPLGSRRELRSLLAELRGRCTRTVLGLRDVIDFPETVRCHWQRDDVYRVLERDYDRVLVYGAREILDTGVAYDLPAAVRGKLRYCGYVTDPAIRGRSAERPRVDGSAASVLATVGGGGDGLPLLRAFLGALPRLPELGATVVTGPLMSPRDRAEIAALAAACPHVVLRDAVADLPREMAAADLVVAMAGYNTVAEILAMGRRAVLMPRTWRYGEHAAGTGAGEEGEQLLRAQALEKAGLAELLLPEAASSQAMEEKLRAALGRGGAPAAIRFDLGGLSRVTDELLELAAEARRDDSV